MAYTARQLIQKAYYLSQVVSRDLQTVTGSQQSDGLDLLNALLDVKGTDLRLIPYFKRDSFNTVVGQEKYTIVNLLQIDAITFNLQDVRFGMNSTTRKEYFSTSRVDNIQSLPLQWRAERVLGGMDIYLYFIPNAVYTVNYSGKFGLSDVTLDTDLLLTFDLYYIEYLRYALAEYICSDWGVAFPQQSNNKLIEISKKLLDVSPKDLSIQKVSYFGDPGVFNWAIVNLSGGYLP